MMPDGSSGGYESEWRSTVITSGCLKEFEEAGLRADGPTVTEFVGRNADNPSSIYSCIRLARENGRAVRTTLTTEMWESLNDTWLSFDQRWADARRYNEIRGFLDWVKERSTLFRGSLYGTMPDHPALLQTYLWQDLDLAPRFPVLKNFLDFWESNLDGRLHSVQVASAGVIAPSKYRFVDGEMTLH